MLIIGSHVKLSGNEMLLGSVKEAISYGANAFMFYTGAPQNTIRKPISTFRKEEAFKLMNEHNISKDNVIVHAPYIINLANITNERTSELATSFLLNEISRVSELGFKYLVLHPGSHVGSGVEKGLDSIVSKLNDILDNISTDVIILLETMAGKGSELGCNIEEMSYLVNNIHKKENIGVCLDTCHLFDSGVDISNFDDYLSLFDSKIGLNYIKCVHVNDSKNTLGSHKDRHENIGYGNIGFDNLIKVIYHPLLKDVPKILETPYVDKNAPYKYEIEMIKSLSFDEKLIEKIKGGIYE